MRVGSLGVLVLAALVVGACGGDSDGDEVLEGEAVEVLMFDHRFEYTEIRIPVGGSVTWVGAGGSAHNAVASDESWSTETVFGNLEQWDGDEALLTYEVPGEYPFFCTFHGNSSGAGMAGTLIVEG